VFFNFHVILLSKGSLRLIMENTHRFLYQSVHSKGNRFKVCSISEFTEYILIFFECCIQYSGLLAIGFSNSVQTKQLYFFSPRLILQSQGCIFHNRLPKVPILCQLKRSRRYKSYGWPKGVVLHHLHFVLMWFMNACPDSFWLSPHHCRCYRRQSFINIYKAYGIKDIAFTLFFY
jgi:hypothetical protein